VTDGNRFAVANVAGSIFYFTAYTELEAGWHACRMSYPQHPRREAVARRAIAIKVVKNN
jgi:hypothetical protein